MPAQTAVSCERVSRLTRASVIEGREFNPVNPLKVTRFWHLNHRDHRKLLVIDGNLAFAGGINISAAYSGVPFGNKRASASRGWRDTHIAIRGPAVTDIQRLFLETWNKQRCKPVGGRQYVRKLQAEGDKLGARSRG